MSNKINDPVLYEWHKDHCDDLVLQGHPKEDHLVCSTCGRNVKNPININKEKSNVGR